MRKTGASLLLCVLLAGCDNSVETAETKAPPPEPPRFTTIEVQPTNLHWTWVHLLTDNKTKMEWLVFENGNAIKVVKLPSME